MIFNISLNTIIEFLRDLESAKHHVHALSHKGVICTCINAWHLADARSWKNTTYSGGTSLIMSIHYMLQGRFNCHKSALLITTDYKNNSISYISV